MKQHNCFQTVIIIRNVSCKLAYIRMISEGSCDTGVMEIIFAIIRINYILKSTHENNYITVK